MVNYEIYVRIIEAVNAIKNDENENSYVELANAIEEVTKIIDELEVLNVIWRKVCTIGPIKMTKNEKLRTALYNMKSKIDSLYNEEKENEKDLDKINLINYDYIPIRYEGEYAATQSRKYINSHPEFKEYCNEIGGLLAKEKIEGLESLIDCLTGSGVFGSLHPRLIPYFEQFYKNQFTPEEVAKVIIKAHKKYLDIKTFKSLRISNVDAVLSSNYYLYKRVLRVKGTIDEGLSFEIIYNKRPNILFNYYDKIYKVAFDMFERQIYEDSFTNQLLKIVKDYLVEHKYCEKDED